MNQIEPVTQTFEINLMPHRQFDQKLFKDNRPLALGPLLMNLPMFGLNRIKNLTQHFPKSSVRLMGMLAPLIT